jgi:hypothetical protein
VGRLANYKYYNMDEAIANALDIFQQEARTLHVITTKFKENLNWIPTMCSRLLNVRISWFIFVKDHEKQDLDKVRDDVQSMTLNEDNCNTQHIHIIDHRENVGREGLAWSDYLFNSTMIKPGDVHLFVQGNMEISMDIAIKEVYDILYQHTLPAHFKSFHLDCGSGEYRGFFEAEYNKIVKDKLGIMNDFCRSLRGDFLTTLPLIHQLFLKYKTLFENDILPYMRKENDPAMGRVLERIWIILFNNALSEIS